MTLSRQHVVGATMILALAATVVGCGGAPSETRALPTFGPESLQVAFLRAPDSLAVEGDVTVTVAAYNRTRGLVTVPLPCAASGFSVRLVDRQDYAREFARPMCVNGSATGSARILPGDSIVATLGGPNPGWYGMYRLQASYVTD